MVDGIVDHELILLTQIASLTCESFDGAALFCWRTLLESGGANFSVGPRIWLITSLFSQTPETVISLTRLTCNKEQVISR